MANKRRAVKKTAKRRLPPSINNGEYYNGSPAVILSRVSAIVEAQLDADEWIETHDKVLIIASMSETYKKVCLIVDSGNLAMIPERDELGEKLVDEMLELALQTAFIAKMNRTKLQNCGFKLINERKPIKANHAPENLRVAPRQITGEIKVYIKKVAASRIYLYCIAEDNGTNILNWESFEWPLVNYTFANLKKGKDYVIKVCSVDKKGQRIYCNPISRVCL